MEQVTSPGTGGGLGRGRAASRSLTTSPLRGTTELLSDQVADRIEQDVLLGRLQAGECLPSEGALCALFSVSRSVVRAALSSLAARDLIDIRAGQRTRVRPPTDETLSRTVLSRLARSDQTLHSVMEGRALIEEALIPLAATRSLPEQRESVREFFLEFERAIDRKDWTAANAQDLNFHRALLEAVNQEALGIMLRPLHMVMFVCSRPIAVESAEAYNVPGHREIADALAAQDEERLRRAVVDHFRYVDSQEYREYGSQPFRDAPNTRLLVENRNSDVDDLVPKSGEAI